MGIQGVLDVVSGAPQVIPVRVQGQIDEIKTLPLGLDAGQPTFRKALDIEPIRVGGCGINDARKGQLRRLDVHVMVQIRPRVVLFVGPPRPPVIGIGSSKHLDQGVVEGQLLLGELSLDVVEGIALRTYEAGDVLGIVEGSDGVVQRELGPFIDLLEVSLGIGTHDQRRIQVEGNAALADAEGRKTSLGIVHGGL